MTRIYCAIVLEKFCFRGYCLAVSHEVMEVIVEYSKMPWEGTLQVRLPCQRDAIRQILFRYSNEKVIVYVWGISPKKAVRGTNMRGPGSLAWITFTTLTKWSTFCLRIREYIFIGQNNCNGMNWCPALPPGTCYITPLLGAWLADSLWGRYKTILVFSVIYLVVSCLSHNVSLSDLALVLHAQLMHHGVLCVAAISATFKAAIVRQFSNLQLFS